MGCKVAKQQITLACSTVVAMRLILTDDLDEEDKTSMTQAHTRGQDWHYTNTHTIGGYQLASDAYIRVCQS